jgi:4a-hydroxytetrahydrobiopterin dehydratase
VRAQALDLTTNAVRTTVGHVARLLETEELVHQLADLPGFDHGLTGSLAVAVLAPTFTDAVRLISLVAVDAERMNHHPDIDLRWRTVFFTLSTHSAGGVTQLDVELAHQILAAAKEIGGEVSATPERAELCVDAVDIDAVRPFWRAVLGYREHHTRLGTIELQDPNGRGPAVWFQQMGDVRRDRNRLHLDVYVPADQARGRVDAALEAGGVLVTDAHAPAWWVLADPEGNEACICTTEPEPRAA